ncbi:MAG TPA: class I adenylate-forming enzyme family protein [Vicinamibacterales bacterium]|nr:class I adenylate-forming enzyme family protein [Vicinamibacterales bacterium]
MTGSDDKERRVVEYRRCGVWPEDPIGHVLGAAARRWPDRELLSFESVHYSYAQIWDWTLAVAHALVQSGVGPGDRVLLQLGNCLELIVTQLAAWRIGAVSVPVVPIYRAHEMRHIIGDSAPRVLVTMAAVGARKPWQELDELLPPSDRPLLKILVGEDPEAFARGWVRPTQQPVSRIEDAGLPDPSQPDAVSLILYTSGTTSLPKGAMLTGRALLSNADSWVNVYGLNDRDVSLGGSPLAHIAALAAAFLIPVRAGGRTVILPRWDADAAVGAIAREGVTFMAGAAVFLSDLVERFEKSGDKPTRLCFLSGGAATPPTLVERAQAVGICAIRCYGMTETAGACSLGLPDASLELRAHCDGRPAPGTEFRIVDDAGRALPPGAIGRVLVQSAQLMQGYTDSQITASQLSGDGWFDTGDLGYLDAEGWFHMAGRTKDIINRGGEKFSSMDIEQAVAGHPDVSSVAVIGVPHERLGEAVAAFVVLRANARWNGPETLIAHLERSALARQKIPAHWVVVDSLPTTASGKVQKAKLAEQFPG